MALRLEIDNGDGRGRVDYTKYIAAPDGSFALLRDRINLPALLDFSLAPGDDQFIAPRRSAYVRLTGLADALPPGGPRVAGPLFTGYITQEPAIEFLGVRNGKALHGFRCQATTEEYLLNVKRIGLLPPFLNQTAGAVLRFLTEYLQPGRFDTTNVADGALLPLFLAPPEKSWGDIARELAERSSFHYWVLEGLIYFQPLGDLPSGITVDENDRRFRPDALDVAPLGNPIQNDVTVIGDDEPQAYVAEYFVGDGFTSRFALTAPMSGAESARLLADDFTGTALDNAHWQETDPGNVMQLFQGRLNVTGGSSVLGQSTLVARQGIELGGELEIIHGEFEVVSASLGVLGGLYGSAALARADCLAGFDVSPIGANTRFRALVVGVVQAVEVVAQPNHHYILVTRLSADQLYRQQQVFPSLGTSFGGAVVAANVALKLEVRDIDLANPATPVPTVLYEGTLGLLPGFAIYAPVNAVDLHVVANFLQVTRPIQAQLETQKPANAPRRRSLGFGIAQQDATITADPNRNHWALEFYEDTIPALGEKITLRYRAAGRALARVRDSASVASEAALAGDDGVRATVLSNLRPAPRTSSEAEFAAQAYLAEHTAARYEGRYVTWGDFVDSFPRSGRFLIIQNESRYPAFSALIRGVASELRELRSERILHTIEFGQPSIFEDLLRQFAPAENILRGEDESAPMPQDTAQVGNAFLPDAPGAALASVTGTQFTVDLGAPPPAGGSYEVRRSDQGWGSTGVSGTAQNLVGNFGAQNISLARSARNHAYYMRPVSSAGTTSRNSSLLAVHYPLPPIAPQALEIVFGVNEQSQPVITATVELTDSQIADVDSVELRDTDDATVLARWSFGQLTLQGGVYRAAHTLDNSVALARTKTLFAHTRNILGEYSAPRPGAGSQFEPLKPSLSAGAAVGQILEVLFSSAPDTVLETEIQVAGPAASFGAPSQDVKLAGHPEKFNFVATQTGGWAFRARFRDSLGWSPWSNEPQGQIGPQTLVFLVQFFSAGELDPSVGAAVNAQNLLPNSEFFLGGTAGQEGTHVARYFALVHAASDGSEVDYSAATNEMQWKAGVNFAAANPGFRSLLSNLGRMLNPGEPVTLSAALRQTGTGGFSLAVRFALRSASTPGYDKTSDVPALTVTGTYQWFSVTFTLPSNQAVPADLAAEITVVNPAGQSVASALTCDKVILNRGHRPAAFNQAVWDVIALAWNAAAAAYDLPATLLAATQRSNDPGSAGLLAGTGTADLDPNFTGRYFRQTA